MDRFDASSPAGSLLGQLELGLGAGFLRALEAPADHVSELVLDCVDRDTRWDRDIDQRGDYYALLLLSAGVDAQAVEALVRAQEPPEPDSEDGQTMPLDVLLRMAVRGSTGARDALRRYLTSGVRWAHLVFGLGADFERTATCPSWHATVKALGAAFCERFSSAGELCAALEDTAAMWDALRGGPMWSLWAAENPVISAAVRQTSYDRDARILHPRTVEDDYARHAPELEAFSTRELLAIEDGDLARVVAWILEHRTSAADRRSLRAAARNASVVMRGPAIEALAYQQRPEALEIAAELHDDIRPRWLRPSMRRALLSLPYDQTRSLAREWLDSDQTMRRRAAAGILEEHGAKRDIPIIREYLRREGLDAKTSDMYLICSLVGALARHPARGPYGELTSIFYGIPYSYARSHVVTAMIATDPEFPDTQVAAECLWDCQPEVRDLGATHVAIADSSIQNRLNVMAADCAEDPDAQLAAQSRVRDQ